MNRPLEIIPIIYKMATKKHVCPVKNCGKEFSKPSRLTIHIRTHTGEVVQSTENTMELAFLFTRKLLRLCCFNGINSAVMAVG